MSMDCPDLVDYMASELIDDFADAFSQASGDDGGQTMICECGTASMLEKFCPTCGKRLCE